MDAHPKTRWLTLRAFAEFVYMDLVALHGFRTIKRVVKRTTTQSAARQPEMLEAVVDAAETAAVFYGKSAYCLQRSAVITRLLRRRGVAAELVIGYHLPPLSAHAWVEVNGRMIGNERPDLLHYYVLDRW